MVTIQPPTSVSILTKRCTHTNALILMHASILTCETRPAGQEGPTKGSVWPASLLGLATGYGNAALEEPHMACSLSCVASITARSRNRVRECCIRGTTHGLLSFFPAKCFIPNRHIPIPNLIFHFPTYEQASTKLCTQLHDATLTKITMKYP